MSTEQKQIQKQEIDDYLYLTLNGCSSETKDVLLQCIYNLSEEITPNLQSFWYKMDVLIDIANGSKSGLVTHHPSDFQKVTNGLLDASENTLKIGTVVCPDWGGHYEKGIWVYDMATLGDGVSQTTRTTSQYLKELSRRSKVYSQDVEVVAQFPVWELTRNESLNNVNGGITSDQALNLLSNTISKTQRFLEPLAHDNFHIKVGIQNPNNFHQDKIEIANGLITANESKKRVRAVWLARQEFYKGRQYSMVDAALEMAEAKLAWTELWNSESPHLTIVPTSPTIARACLSGNETPQGWIQLKHGYQG